MRKSDKQDDRLATLKRRSIVELDNTPPSALARQGHTHAKRLRRSLLIAHLLLLFVSIPLGFLATTGTSLARPIPEVALAPKARVADPAPLAQSIVFVHGFEDPRSNGGSGFRKGASNGFDCKAVGQNGYWGDAESFLGKMLPGEDFRTIKYYKGDKNCDEDLHADAYRNHCLHYQSGGGEGTNDESIYHLSCLFAWYLHDNFAGKSEIVIAHSMGGLILREAIYQVQNRAHLGTGNTFPDDIGHITEAITFNTPHQGVNPNAAYLACGGCQQFKDMSQESPFMKELLTKGQDPQAGRTDWTLIGSRCDEFIQPHYDFAGSALIMDGANHVVAYAGALPPTGPNPSPPNNTCYNHGGTLHDPGRNLDLTAFYCDTHTLGRCSNEDNWNRLDTAPHGLEAIYQVIANQGYSPVKNPPEEKCTIRRNRTCLS